MNVSKSQVLPPVLAFPNEVDCHGEVGPDPSEVFSDHTLRISMGVMGTDWSWCGARRQCPPDFTPHMCLLTVPILMGTS